MHPDGDEILYVVSGTMRLTYDSGQESMDLKPGEACIVGKGEWYLMDCKLFSTLSVHGSLQVQLANQFRAVVPVDSTLRQLRN